MPADPPVDHESSRQPEFGGAAQLAWAAGLPLVRGQLLVGGLGKNLTGRTEVMHPALRGEPMTHPQRLGQGERQRDELGRVCRLAGFGARDGGVWVEVGSFGVEDRAPGARGLFAQGCQPREGASRHSRPSTPSRSLCA
ncbi:hypothetical protein [Streptomyces sp. NPDC029674]|uniref:hypothetical protein n=1 Tax=Streptomyces sp. NPDC029674 TaxID=3365297 RepID=UPI0038510DB4